MSLHLAFGEFLQDALGPCGTAAFDEDEVAGMRYVAKQLGHFFGRSDRRAVRQAGRARGRGNFRRARAECNQAIDA